MKRFAEVILDLRKSKRWTQGQLSYKTGLSESAISMIERGERLNPEAETIAKLSDGLDVSADYLLVEAGFKQGPQALDNLSPHEQRLIESLRRISDAAERQEILDHIIGLVAFSADVDRIVQDRLRLVAEEGEKYRAEENSNGD